MRKHYHYVILKQKSVEIQDSLEDRVDAMEKTNKTKQDLIVQKLDENLTNPENNIVTQQTIKE